MSEPFRRHSGAARLARILALMVLVGGSAATFMLADSSRTRHREESIRLFTAESETLHNAVKRQLDLFLQVLTSIGHLHNLSDQVSAEDFDEFTHTGMLFQRHILSAYGFAQRIPDALRKSAARRATDPLAIFEPAPEGGVVQAAERQEYFPLVYQYPEGSLGFPLGLDLASLPGTTEALGQLQRQPVLIRDFTVQDISAGTGYFILSPQWQKAGENPPTLSGLTVSILWPQRILESALADFPSRDVQVRFYDPERNPPAKDQDAPEDLVVSAPLEVANHSWIFETRATPAYRQKHRSDLPTVILATGGAITLLLTATIWLLAGRTRHIEQVVAERTAELKETNRLLSEAMHERMRLESEILEISEREKRQVGQDLHDSLGQKLTGAVFLGRAMADHVDTDPGEARNQAGRVVDILKDAVAQVRRMARGLSPVDLGEEGLTGALQRLADETSSVYGISCLFHHADEDLRPTAKAAHHLYAIALECVNNAVRHGKAREVVIELRRNGDGGCLEIEDNGSGFDPEKTVHGGLGLSIMRYRAGMIGGHLEVARRSSGGMAISCAFPCL